MTAGHRNMGSDPLSDDFIKDAMPSRKAYVEVIEPRFANSVSTESIITVSGFAMSKDVATIRHESVRV